jgi:hypothetical protein
MKRPTPIPLRRERGQAMVEMIVVGGVVSAIFLGIWYLGKFHDIQYSTIQAARYAAWERSAHAPSFSDTRLQSQTRARLFMWNQDAYKAADGKPDGATWGAQNGQWQDHAQDKRLIARPNDVRISTAAGALPGTGAKFFENLIGMLSAAGGAITGGEPLNQGGLYTSTVSVKISDVALLEAPLNNLNLTLTERSALVTDNWDASGAAQTAKRTRSFTPAAGMNQIDGLLGPLKMFLSVLEPSFINFNPGQICPDVVPADRVQARRGANLPVYRGGGACD